MTKYFVLIVCLIPSLFLVNSSNATIWYVHPDSSLNAIQAGLDSCSAGDTVLVAPGTYQETLIWPSVPGIDLISEFGPDVTVIDANGAGRVITMAQYLTPVTVIDGFGITNGWATGTSPDDYGGGIYCLNTSPTIRNNVIGNNSAYSRGGGIYCENSNPHIIGNIIYDNGTSGRGGGISCYDEADALIRENSFSNNSAEFGGTIDCYDDSDPTIQYNQILNGNATYGGGIYSSSIYQAWCTPATHYNNISGNEAWGIYNNELYTSVVPAQNNWWGHAAGPDSGDEVHGGVSYDPWLTEEIVFDIEAISIEEPPDSVASGSTYTPMITMRNNCNYNYPASFFTAKCTIDDYEDYVRIKQPIPQDSTMEVRFADWVAPHDDPVTYLMSVTLFYAVDQVPTNDTLSKQICYTDVKETEVTSSPSSFALFQNYPNPFNPTTTIEYSLKKTSYVKLVVLNILGQKIRTLVDEPKRGGNHVLIWDGKDDKGKKVASGIYFCKIKAGELTGARKMLLLK